jgi:hypothetical protein
MDLATSEIVSAYFKTCKERKWRTRPTRVVESELKDLMSEIHNAQFSHNIKRDGTVRGYKNVTFK